MELKKIKVDDNILTATPSESHCDIWAQKGKHYSGENNESFYYTDFNHHFDISDHDRQNQLIVRGEIPKSYEYLKDIIWNQWANLLKAQKQPDFNSLFVNYNRFKRYHKDQHDIGNMRFLMCFRKESEGGVLCFPEFNIKFPMDNQTMLIYRSSDIYHGVTPCRYDRTTILFFTAHARSKTKRTDNNQNQGPLLVR